MNVRPNNHPQYQHNPQFEEVIFGHAVSALRQNFNHKLIAVLEKISPDKKREVVAFAVKEAQRRFQEEAQLQSQYSLEEISVYEIVESLKRELVAIELLDTSLKQRGSGMFTFHRDEGESAKGMANIELKIEALEGFIEVYKKGWPVHKDEMRRKFKIPMLHQETVKSHRALVYSDIPKQQEISGKEEYETRVISGPKIRETNGVYEDDYLACLNLLLYSLKFERDFNGTIDTIKRRQSYAETLKGPLKPQSVSIKTTTMGFEVGNMNGGKLKKISLESPKEGQSVWYLLASEYYKMKHPGFAVPQNLKAITREQFQSGVGSRIPIFLAYESFLFHVFKMLKEGYTIDLRSNKKVSPENIFNIFGATGVGVTQKGDHFEFCLNDNNVYLTKGASMFSWGERAHSYSFDKKVTQGWSQVPDYLEERSSAKKQTKQRNQFRTEVAHSIKVQLESLFGSEGTTFFGKDEPIPLV